jgi:gliding motility-associated-like protein
LVYRFSYLIIGILAMLFLVENASAQMEFVQNKGQWNDKINYKADFSTGSFFLENKGFTVVLNKPEDLIRIREFSHGHSDKSAKNISSVDLTLHSFAYNVTFLGAARNAQRIPDKPLTIYKNYFIGSDEKKWASECKVYNAVTYKNVYPNIDVRYYTTQDKLKYDFIVHPGGNPAAIAMRYDGVTSLSVKKKELIIGTSVGEVKELNPYTYQTNVSKKLDVVTRYVVRDNVVTFDVGNYDPNATLVIDPQIIFCSFTGSSADNWGYTATPGIDGSFFAGGVVDGNGYPTSVGAYQTNARGGKWDIGIMKFSPNGSAAIYATYLGGNGDDFPHSMIADAAGNLIIAGKSNSPDYPTINGIGPRGGYDIIVTKLNPSGTALLGSVKIGGTGDDGVNIREKEADGTNGPGTDRLRRNYGDDARSEVILDGSNNVYVASCSQSNNFPTANAFQTANLGKQDGVILKFNSNLSGLLFSTYFGGGDEDACFVAAINTVTGNVYVAGATMSGTLPGDKTGVIYPTTQGNIDGFVTELSPNGAVIKTTFIGTNGIDLVYGLKFDKLGFPYISGTTTGDWQNRNANYFITGGKQFIAKLKPDLSEYVYSTAFGKAASVPDISPTAFLVDRCENVYVSGWGGGINATARYTNGNTNGLPEVNPLSPIQAADGQDFYFFVLAKDAQSQFFGSHFGQNGGFGDHVDGGTSRFDANGIIYQAVCANCFGRSGSPAQPFTTSGVHAELNGSIAGCNEAAVKIEMNFSGIGAQIQSEIEGEINDSLGCIPLFVNFKDLRGKGVTYYWNFNSAAPGRLNIIDTTTTNPAANHLFDSVGVYRVRLIAEDPATCNQRDTSYITIKTGKDRVRPSFTNTKVGACTSKDYTFTNTSTTVSTGAITFLPQTFIWDFGDGSPVDTANFSDIIPHTFPSSGTYKVKLTVIDSRFCNSPKDTIIPLRINDNVTAKPSSSELGCAPYTPVFKNESDAGLTWLWELFDATTNAIVATSTDFVPTFAALPVGNYKYRLTAFDSTTCNKFDVSAFKNIRVVQKPQASFSWAPNPPEPNVPVRFTNLSSFSDSYLWNFGDGENSTEFAPVHEYNATKIYNAELIAYSIAGCTDTAKLPVNVIVNPLLDVPNAFTPGRFGVNSIVNVRGFGIDKMDWRIYNRWGQMIFRSANKRIGWDGTYRGKLQPIDVYSYTLDVELTDGKKIRKTGDITLLR